MRMRTGVIAAVLAALATAASAQAPAPMREFDQPTTISLGRQLQAQSHMITVAAYTARTGGVDLAAERLDRWVAVSDTRMRLLRRSVGGQVDAPYDVVFAPGTEPQLVKAADPKLGGEMLTRVRAGDTAIKAAGPLCSGEKPIVAVSKDPQRDGWLVWLLRPSGAGIFAIGGHVRVSVSADGAKATQVDSLSSRCDTWEMPDARARMAAEPVVAIDLDLSDAPLETHVLIALQTNAPLVTGVDNDTPKWIVSRDTIRPWRGDPSAALRALARTLPARR